MKIRLCLLPSMRLMLFFSLLICLNSPAYAALNDAKLAINTNSFTAISIKGSLTIIIKKGDNCRIDTDSNSLSKVNWYIVDGTLFLSCIDGSCTHLNVINIQAPSLKKVDIHGAASTTISGFDPTDSFTLNSWGASNTSVQLNSSEVHINLFNTSVVTISGEAKHLELFSTDASMVKGYSLKVNDARISCSKVSNIQLTVHGALNANMDGLSQLHYKGNPSKQTIVTSGRHVIRSEG